MKQQRDGIDIPDFRNTVALTDAQCQALKDAGKQFIIVEYTYHDHFVEQVRQLKRWQFDVSSYNFLYWSKTDAEILTTASNSAVCHMDSIKELQGEGIELGWWRPDGTFCPQVWWDGETDTVPTLSGLPEVNPTADRSIPLLGSCVEWAASPKYELASGIYTGEYWWKACTGNWDGLAGYPLWHASQYVTTIPSPFAQYFQGHEYGGWGVPQLWQYRGSRSDIADVNCDWTLEEFNAA